MCAFQAVLENNGLEGGAGEIARNDGVGLLFCFLKTCGLWAFQAFFFKRRMDWRSGAGDDAGEMARNDDVALLDFSAPYAGLSFVLGLFSSPVIMIAMLLVCRFAGSLSGR